jgi:hypothetical protein
MMIWESDPGSAGTYRSGDYRIEHIWATPQESFDLYYKDQPIAGGFTLEWVKESAEIHVSQQTSPDPSGRG